MGDVEGCHLHCLLTWASLNVSSVVQTGQVTYGHCWAGKALTAIDVHFCVHALRASPAPKARFHQVPDDSSPILAGSTPLLNLLGWRSLLFRELARLPTPDWCCHCCWGLWAGRSCTIHAAPAHSTWGHGGP